MVIRRRAASAQAGSLPIGQAPSTLADALNARAVAAVGEAREMPPGDERTEAMHKATALRNAADMHAFLSSKRDTPAG